MRIPYEKALKRGFPAFQFLTNTGAADGDWDMGVNGSVIPQTFQVTAEADSTYYIHRIVCSVFSNTQQSIDGFGTLGELTTGIQVGIIRSDSTFDQILPVNVKKMCCLARLGSHLESLLGSANQTHVTATLD